MMYEKAARQIKLLRTTNNISRAKLAEDLGVSEKFIYFIEKRQRKGSLYFYKNVANYFKVSFDYLFAEDIQNKKNIYVDTVMIRMSYMEEQDQKMVLKFVEDFSDYISEREKGKE